ncbi:MAG: hypothetical protein QM754_05140 [Tepidisphaeraceae bacterium]
MTQANQKHRRENPTVGLAAVSGSPARFRPARDMTMVDFDRTKSPPETAGHPNPSLVRPIPPARSMTNCRATPHAAT